MEKTHIIYKAAASVMVMASLMSCNDFLDKMPDNRTTIDTEEKVASLLTTSYPTSSMAYVNELMSDNSDYYGDNNPYGDIFSDQVFFWEDVTESSNDCPDFTWEGSYLCIAQANQALASIDELGGATTDKLKTSKGEALLLRAYNHFVLVNEFCMAYNTKTSTTDLGIPYSTSVEKLTDKHDRGNVAEVYQNIEKDIEEGLKYISDDYSVPKYHFNRNAAYAFAARFYLYYEKWDKAVEYANKVLGTNTSLRNWQEMASLPSEFETLTNKYVNIDNKCNLMMNITISALGGVYGKQITGCRCTHGSYLGNNEDVSAPNFWGNRLYYTPLTRRGPNFDVCRIWKLSYQFEIVDPVSQNGYYNTVTPLFTTDKLLIDRAEAYIMMKEYDKAAADIDKWAHNMYSTSVVITPSAVQAFYNKLAYAYSDDAKMTSSIKKHLNPAFQIDAEGSVQECMLQLVLQCRRIETLHEGYRWLDIKRYGIEIPRRTMGVDGNPLKTTDWLSTDDPRRAVQIPAEILAAGVQPNPRNK